MKAMKLVDGWIEDGTKKKKELEKVGLYFPSTALTYPSYSSKTFFSCSVLAF